MEKLLQEYEHRIVDLRATLRWIREAAGLWDPENDSAGEILARIQQHAVAALQHDNEQRGE
jgi:hypothetical protein